MTTATPDFETLFKLYPAFTAQSQAVGKIALDAFTGIAAEQVKAAETMVEYGTKAFKLPESADAAAIIGNQYGLQTELFESLSASADKIFAIATEASDKAMATWLKNGETEEAAA